MHGPGPARGSEREVALPAREERVLTEGEAPTA